MATSWEVIETMFGRLETPNGERIGYFEGGGVRHILAGFGNQIRHGLAFSGDGSPDYVLRHIEIGKLVSKCESWPVWKVSGGLT